MVDERDEHYDGQEEGEYHFSDDQMNYEDDIDAPKMTGAAVATVNKVSFKEFLMTKFAQHRKVVIGTSVFLVLLVVAYKMVMPSSTAPTTDFAAAPAAPAPKVAAAQSAASKTPPPANQPAPPAAQPAALQQTAESAPAVVPTGTVTVNQPAAPGAPIAGGAPVQAGGATASAANVPLEVAQGQPPAPFNPQGQGQTLSPMQQAQQSTMLSTQGADAAGQQNMAGAMMQPPQSMPVAQPMDVQTKNVNDRLASLEQQNAAMMNLLQTEYAQKISDYETQSTAMRGKMEEMTKRLNRMESALTQISRMLQNGGAQSNVNMVNAAPQGMMVGMAPQAEPARATEPKTTYAVQAIIPGRAWLKSESGDTVTVAEGDVLRGYGRITKIDPYDGVVNIDTGNKVITLSYGMNAE